MAKLPFDSCSVFIRGRAWKLYIIHGIDFGIFHPDITKPEEAPFGICDFSTEIIILNKDFPLQAVLDTLYHEISHAIFSIQSGSKANQMGHVEEEVACNLLGYAIPEIIPQHKRIVSFIKQQHRKK